MNFTTTKIHRRTELTKLNPSTAITAAEMDELLTELEQPDVQNHLALQLSDVGIADILDVLSRLADRRVALAQSELTWTLLSDITPLRWVCNKATHCEGDDTAHRNGQDTGCCKMSTNGNKTTWKTGLLEDAVAWRAARGLDPTAEVSFFANPGSRELFVTTG